MWGIIGLGNPGRRYSKTRHNIGFAVVDEIALRSSINLKERVNYKAGKGSIEDTPVVLVEPLTFMNRSGQAVREIIRRFGVAPENLIIVQDDIDMETGRLKIKLGGSSGGHKGIQSIIQDTGTSDFIRVKIGIGREHDMLVEDYVLKKFSRAEEPFIKEAMAQAIEAIGTILTMGVQTAMNRFNKKPQPSA